MEDPDKLAILTFADTEWEAETIAAAMRVRDIPALVEGGYVAGWRVDAPVRAKVMVFQRDLQRARLAAREAAFVGASIDWDDVDVGEPEGPAAAPSTVGGSWTGVFLALLLVAVGVVVWTVLQGYLKQP